MYREASNETDLESFQFQMEQSNSLKIYPKGGTS